MTINVNNKLLKMIKCDNCQEQGMIIKMINYRERVEEGIISNKYVCTNCGMIYDEYEILQMINKQLLGAEGSKSQNKVVTLYNEKYNRLEDYLLILQQGGTN